MANRSTFPTTIDSFLEHYDISSTDVINVLRFQELKLKTSLISEEQTELTNLTTTLRDKIFTPEDFNKLQDCITNMETFLRDNVEGYIVAKQTEFNNKIAQFTVKGEYNPTVQYVERNIVTYQGEGYICKLDSLGNTPVLVSDYWDIIAKQGIQGERGIDGKPGLGLINKHGYDSLTPYIVGDAVTYNGSVYYCILDSPGGYPPTDETYWELFIAKGSNTILKQLDNQVTLDIDSANVPIGIPEFNYLTDVLWVFKNSVYVAKSDINTGYVLNTNHTSIDKADSTTWGAGTVFNFKVLKNMVVDFIYTDGTLIQDGTIHIAKLAPDAKPTISLVAPSNPVDGQRWVDLND